MNSLTIYKLTFCETSMFQWPSHKAYKKIYDKLAKGTNKIIDKFAMSLKTKLFGEKYAASHIRRIYEDLTALWHAGVQLIHWYFKHIMSCTYHKDLKFIIKKQ